MIQPKQKPRLADIRSHYDELDSFYREIWGEHVHHGLWISGRESQGEAVLQLSRLVAERARIQAGDAVCDIGCGYGATSRWLVSEYQAMVTALTVSKAQYDYARKIARGRRNPRYLCRDWLKNRLKKKSFDALVAIESSEHMASPAGFFAEAYRVLRPGGRLVVCAWLSRENPRETEIRYLLEPICREGRLHFLGTARDYRRTIQSAGFRSVHGKDLTSQVKKTWAICIRRAAWRIATDPGYRRFLWKSPSSNKIFAKTLLRMWAAYGLGSLRYALFTAVKR